MGDFRNGPEAKAPGGQQDMADVARYMFQNGHKHGIDPDLMLMGGASGGAWIAMGAANLLAKSDEVSRIKALFLGAAMLSGEVSRIPESEVTESDRNWGTSGDRQQESNFKLLASDYDTQRLENDDQLYP